MSKTYEDEQIPLKVDRIRHDRSHAGSCENVILITFLCPVRYGEGVLFFRGYEFFLLFRRDYLMAGVDCHAHAAQCSVSKILVCFHSLLVACVEAACHESQCSEGPIFMCFHFICPPMFFQFSLWLYDTEFFVL